jgi:hypothetical protein
MLVMDSIEKLCKNAVCSARRRGDILLCAAGKGKTYELPLLRPGDVCVATTFFSTGHSKPDAYVDPAKIQGCPYRKV